jgi:uncharacterized membrane protein
MKKIIPAIILLSVLGFLDAGYLTYEHYRFVIPPCSLHAWFSDCGAVLTSHYSTLFGVPVSALGVLYYIAVLLVSFGLLLELGKEIVLEKLLVIIVTLGALTSLSFIALQFFILHAICPYCMVSDTVCIIIFGIVFYSLFKNKPHTSEMV